MSTSVEQNQISDVDICNENKINKKIKYHILISIEKIRHWILTFVGEKNLGVESIREKKMFLLLTKGPNVVMHFRLSIGWKNTLDN